MYSILIVPFRIGFEVDNDALDIIDFILNGFFFIDMAVNFNTALIDIRTDKLITDRLVVTLEYLKFWFWVDVVSTVPFDELLSLALGMRSTKLQSFRLVRVFRLLRLIKLVRFVKFSRLIIHLENLHINPALINVMGVFVQMVFATHLSACFWFFITTKEVIGNSGVMTWAAAAGLVDAPVLDQYFASLYWTFACMLGIGYGDITPHNLTERLYAIVAMLFGSVMFGAIIAQATRLLESQNPHARIMKTKLTEIKSYLVEKNCPPILKTKIKVLHLLSIRPCIFCVILCFFHSIIKSYLIIHFIC